MADKIDWKFIGSLEGAGITKGYVPLPDTSKSGVTIATGFDLGQRNLYDLKRLGLSADLIKLFTPYLGLKKQPAVKYLAEHPLTITKEQVAQIDKAVKSSQVASLRTKYNLSDLNKAKVQFDDLPSQAQTVIASVAFQYGDIQTKWLELWKAMAAQDWQKTVKILRGASAYVSRRKKEADLLEQIVKLDKKTADLLARVSLWRVAALLFVSLAALSISVSAQNKSTIFNADLAKAFGNYDKSVSQKRSPLMFESGATVSDCAEYWREKEKSTIKEEVANMLYHSEYLVCDSLRALKNEKDSLKNSPRRPSAAAANYGKQLYDRLNLKSFPSSVSDTTAGKSLFFRDVQRKLRPRIDKYGVTSNVKDWFYKIQTVAETDFDGDGKKDLIIWLIDESKDGNYRDYQTLLISDVGKKGLLNARAL